MGKHNALCNVKRSLYEIAQANTVELVQSECTDIL